MCQADLVNEIKDLQNQLKGGVNRIQKRRLLQEMEKKASDALRDKDKLITHFVGDILSKVEDNEEDENKKIIILNTLLLLAFPEDCLGVTKLVEEMKDIKGVSNIDIGKLLTKIKEHLGLSGDYSPIVIMCKRYN
jgi:hypothetical protein